jgi:hypothetical protein
VYIGSPEAKKKNQTNPESGFQSSVGGICLEKREKKNQSLASNDQESFEKASVNQSMAHRTKSRDEHANTKRLDSAREE